MAIYTAFALLLSVLVVMHVRRFRRREHAAREAIQRPGAETEGPRGRHPHIDTDSCIGCGACVSACPEGDVLAVIGGKAALINGHKCIGHELCSEACPVGAISIVMAPPSMTADLPVLTVEHETNIENLFVVGELGGLALIKNAVNQGRECVDTIAERLGSRSAGPDNAVSDLVIVGAGPAGLSASLRALERGLRFVTLEAEELGGTVAKYPRQKLILTSPVEFPTYGRFKKLEISKEDLLELWSKAARKAGLAVRTNERVEAVERAESGEFTVVTTRAVHRARAVVLALGRRGTPKKLGVPGEELPHVMYSLLDAESYRDQHVLVVGGGDSAIEAALGLAHQPGNRVTVSYRRATFSRLKQRNDQHVRDAIKHERIQVIFNSHPIEIRSGVTVLDLGGEHREIPSDFVWIFAGGTPPKPMLERMGVAFGRQEMAQEARAAVGG